MAVYTTFNRFRVLAFQKVVDLETDVIKLALVTNAVVPVATASEPRFQSSGASHDFSSSEVSGSGYTAGGIDIGGTVTEVVPTYVRFDGTINPLWEQNPAGPTDIYYGILYSETSVNKICIGYIDLGGPLSLRDGPLSIIINTAGFFSLFLST